MATTKPWRVYLFRGKSLDRHWSGGRRSDAQVEVRRMSKLYPTVVWLPGRLLVRERRGDEDRWQVFIHDSLVE